MHIGILACDRVPARLHRRFGDYPAMFRALLGHRAGLTYRDYRLSDGEFPARTDECDAWLFTGSAASAFDDVPWIERAHTLVNDLHAARRPMVGVCFGHQLVARALGGRVERARAGWGVGVHRVRLHERPAWMTPAADEFAWLVSHRDQVVAPPPGARWLAGHPFCPYGMLQLGEHTLTLQGHPEFVPGLARAVMERRRAQIGETAYREGVASLARTPDARLVGSWIHKFLARATGSQAPLA